MARGDSFAISNFQEQEFHEMRLEMKVDDEIDFEYIEELFNSLEEEKR